jgi:hypothetical protein
LLDISTLKGRRRRPERGGRRPERRRRRMPKKRRWRAKAPRISELGGSSPPRVVQGLFLLLLSFVEWLLVYDLL